MSCVEDASPKVVCSSSGMLTQGRSIMYLKKILPRSNCSILTVGYMAKGGIGYKIKNNSEQKTITIDQVAYKNRCDIKCLDSFSSHAQYEQLMSTYVELANNGTEVIWLVHGDEGKLEFKKELEYRMENELYKAFKHIYNTDVSLRSNLMQLYCNRIEDAINKGLPLEQQRSVRFEYLPASLGYDTDCYKIVAERI